MQTLPTRTMPFFVTALGFTWLLQLPALLAHLGWIAGPAERFVVPAIIGGFGPLIAAVLVAGLEAGASGVRAVFRAPLERSPSAGWYLVALGLFPIVYVAGHGSFALFGGDDSGAWLYPPENGRQLVGMLIMPLAEEPGWRGFALPRLQARYGALVASLGLGVVWALWHVPMFVLGGEGSSLGVFALFSLHIVAGSVLFSWLYNRAGARLLVAVIAHASVHLNNPGRAQPESLTPFVVYTVALVVAATALVLLDRSAFPAAFRRHHGHDG